MSWFNCCIALATVLVCSSDLHAKEPAIQTDQDLAGSPIVVLAKWEKVPLTEPVQVATESRKYGERSTKLKILRVIKGKDLVPGNYELILSPNAWWPAHGKSFSYSRWGHGDRDLLDLTQPNLWFLSRRDSSDADAKVSTLELSHYVEVQSPLYEAYFKALASARPEIEVPKLLNPDQPEVSKRVLRFLVGGARLWPYDRGGRMEGPRFPPKAGNILREEASHVWSFVNSKADAARPMAVAVYAELKGKDGLTDYRSLLTDRDPLVRAVAMGILARLRDAASLEKMPAALRGVEDSHLGCMLVEGFLAWGDDRVVPLLITFLENVNCEYMGGNNIGAPAFKSRLALHELTGHWFPPNVTRSAQAWQQAAAIPDKVKRQERLQKLLPGQEFPFPTEIISQRDATHEEVVTASKGEFAPDEHKSTASSKKFRIATVRIRNVTTEPVVLAAKPYFVSFVSNTSGGGYSGNGLEGRLIQEKPTFVTIIPGRSHEFELKIPGPLVRGEPSQCRLSLIYLQNGKEQGVNAWVGRLSVEMESAAKVTMPIETDK